MKILTITPLKNHWFRITLDNGKIGYAHKSDFKEVNGKRKISNITFSRPKESI